MQAAAGVDNTHRRKFDLEEYAEKARERERKVSTFQTLSAVVCFYILFIEMLIALFNLGVLHCGFRKRRELVSRNVSLLSLFLMVFFVCFGQFGLFD